MKRRRNFLVSTLLVLMLASGISAQSQAYAKFGAAGETVGLYNLQRTPPKCSIWEVVEDVVASVSSRKRPKEIQYLFALKATVGQRLFRFSLGLEDISQADVRDLLSTRKRVRVRACRSTGYWAVDQVTRASS